MWHFRLTFKVKPSYVHCKFFRCKKYNSSWNSWNLSFQSQFSNFLIGTHASNSHQLASQETLDTSWSLVASRFGCYMFLYKHTMHFYWHNQTKYVVRLLIWRLVTLKPKAFIAGITENPAARIFFIHFSIDNSFANISLYALSCSKLNFGYYLTFKINF